MANTNQPDTFWRGSTKGLKTSQPKTNCQMLLWCTAKLLQPLRFCSFLSESLQEGLQWFSHPQLASPLGLVGLGYKMAWVSSKVRQLPSLKLPSNALSSSGTISSLPIWRPKLQCWYRGKTTRKRLEAWRTCLYTSLQQWLCTPVQ